MEYTLLAPAGSNYNYIAQVLTDAKIESMLAYHYHHNGSHLPERTKGWFNYTHWENKDKKFSAKEKFTLGDPLFIQVLCKSKLHMILINWFEKHSRIRKDDIQFLTMWKEHQSKIWVDKHSNKEHRFIQAVANWYYKLQDPECRDIKDIIEVKNKFLFESFYTGSHHALQTEFAQYKKDYTKEMYNAWYDSQTIALKSEDAVLKNIQTPERLESFWQKGIAIGIYGVENNLNEQEAWDKFYG